MDDGWIKLHRSALDCDQFKSDWLWRLWCWCLLKARHASSQGRNPVVPRGSFITGKLRASEELGVHPSKWYRGIYTLSEPPYSCIHILANRDRTMITVMNYDTYQGDSFGIEPPANHGRTTSEPPANTIEECKKGRMKEGKKKAAPPLPPADWLPPQQLDTPAFRQLWHKWEQYRKTAKKDPLTDHSRELQLVALAKLGETDAIEIIEHTISSNWSGLRGIDGRTLSQIVKDKTVSKVVTAADMADYDPNGGGA